MEFSPANWIIFLALCFRDTLNDQDYITYIYLDQGNLKELFTSDSSSANASAGTTIAQLSDFQISESRPGFYSFELKDSEGNKETFLSPSEFRFQGGINEKNIRNIQKQVSF